MQQTSQSIPRTLVTLGKSTREDNSGFVCRYRSIENSTESLFISYSFQITYDQINLVILLSFRRQLKGGTNNTLYMCVKNLTISRYLLLTFQRMGTFTFSGKPHLLYFLIRYNPFAPLSPRPSPVCLSQLFYLSVLSPRLFPSFLSLTLNNLVRLSSNACCRLVHITLYSVRGASPLPA